jgi:two-component system response regulator AtoC
VVWVAVHFLLYTDTRITGEQVYNISHGEAMSSVLVIDDKKSMREMLEQTLVSEGFNVNSVDSGSRGVEIASEKSFDVVVTDLMMPDMDGIKVLSELKSIDPDTAVIMMTAYGTIENAVEAMKLGAFDFITKPFETSHLTFLIRRALEQRQLEAENEILKEEIESSHGYDEIIGDNVRMHEVMRLMKKVASSDTSVLLLGESGTGKELFARAIHKTSPRKEKPFIAINCAAIPRELLENELFGSEKGAFTSSTAKKMGKFEIANGGTVFLDEIGDMDPALQAKLLRVLQDKQFDRLGGTQTISVNVRVIAASNADLKVAIEQKRFREDLFYRLSVFPITIPPLRDRPDDVPALAEHFLNKYCREMGKPKMRFSKDALRVMDKYNWPGNVRELENTVERAIILCEGRVINADNLAIRLPSAEEIRLREGAGLKEVGQHAQMVAERAMIIRILKDTKGNKRKAADILQIDYTTLFEKIKKYEIDTIKEV